MVVGFWGNWLCVWLFLFFGFCSIGCCWLDGVCCGFWWWNWWWLVGFDVFIVGWFCCWVWVWVVCWEIVGCLWFVWWLCCLFLGMVVWMVCIWFVCCLLCVLWLLCLFCVLICVWCWCSWFWWFWVWVVCICCGFGFWVSNRVYIVCCFFVCWIECCWLYEGGVVMWFLLWIDSLGDCGESVVGVVCYVLCLLFLGL